MPAKKNPQGRKPGAKIKAVTDREKFTSKRKTNGTGDGVWKVVGGVRKFFPKP